MDEKNKNFKKAGVVTGAIIVVLMLTVGISVVRYQNASVVKPVATTDVTRGCPACEAAYDGENITYCYIAANGAPFIIDGIQSGEFTFSELQNYLNDYASGGYETGGYVTRRASFDSVDKGVSLPDGGAIPSDVIPSDIISVDIRLNVTQTLLDRLQEAQLYCQNQEPADWRFHPEALCLAAAMIPHLGVAMATGVVTAFFALFGPLAYVEGVIFWILILRGVGIIDPQMLELSADIYERCMDVFGGGSSSVIGGSGSIIDVSQNI